MEIQSPLFPDIVDQIMADPEEINRPSLTMVVQLLAGEKLESK